MILIWGIRGDIWCGQWLVGVLDCSEYVGVSCYWCWSGGVWPVFFGEGGLQEGGRLIECVSQWGVLGMLRYYGGVCLLCEGEH